ncbi:MAG: glycosyltransferase [Sandaracinaceae bacterium]|nr:glycosyltransferase [Sandaracinaceae bacterium]
MGAATAAQHDAVHVHGKTLAAARNIGAQAATTEWLVFLDADDELSEGYCDAILAADGDLRAPALHLIYPTRSWSPTWRPATSNARTRAVSGPRSDVTCSWPSAGSPNWMDGKTGRSTCVPCAVGRD